MKLIMMSLPWCVSAYVRRASSWLEADVGLLLPAWPTLRHAPRDQIMPADLSVGIQQARHAFDLPLAVEQEAALDDDLVSLVEAVEHEEVVATSPRLVRGMSARAELQFDQLVRPVLRQPVRDPPPSGVEHCRHGNGQFAVVGRLSCAVSVSLSGSLVIVAAPW